MLINRYKPANKKNSCFQVVKFLLNFSILFPKNNINNNNNNNNFFSFIAFIVYIFFMHLFTYFLFFFISVDCSEIYQNFGVLFEYVSIFFDLIYFF